jgi:hypothetical protein
MKEFSCYVEVTASGEDENAKRAHPLRRDEDRRVGARGP